MDLDRATLRRTMLIGLLGAFAAIPSSAAETVRLRAPGTVKAGERAFPGEIRVICDDPEDVEVQFAITFRDGAEAAGSDAIFPFSVYEGPDGKAAPMTIEIAGAETAAVKRNVQSGAGWFGVENEYLFSLRLVDAKRFLHEGEKASTVAVTVSSGASRLAYSFANVSATLGGPAAACR